MSSLGTWEQLDQVIKWTGLSVNAFARSIGLKRSENLYQIRKGNNNVSKELAEIISIKYPEISKDWLLDGIGEMLVDRTSVYNRYVKTGVPFYNVDINLIDENIFKNPLYHLHVPIFDGCDFASLFTSESMLPEIPVGSTLIFKSCKINDFSPGDIYLIISEGFKGVRILRTVADDQTKLRLVPKNITDFDEIIIKKADIKQIFIVKGIIISRNL